MGPPAVFYSQIFYIVEYTNLDQKYKKGTLTNQMEERYSVTCIENLQIYNNSELPHISPYILVNDLSSFSSYE